MLLALETVAELAAAGDVRRYPVSSPSPLLASLLAISSQLFSNTALLSSQELAIFQRAKAKFEDLLEENFEPLESPDVFVKMGKLVQQGGLAGIGFGATTVDTTPEECAAWEWSKLTRQGTNIYRASNGVERNVRKINDHASLYHIVYDLRVSVSGYHGVDL